ncbi:MAG: HipA N-terminal domain-containing protein [Bacteriovoracaceae bacterium]|nr:HipA N-terminal domain-containing protein [Bacteriovoracaceae bacterium]
MKNSLVLRVYIEKRATRNSVGVLYINKDHYMFEYSKEYAYSKSAIPVGPDLSLEKRTHKSKVLFPSFQDRIPSKSNPAYKKYCKKFNIDENEKDQLLLLATIGKKGPSSFVFEIYNNKEYTSMDYLLFRKDLKMTIRDFSTVFSVPLSTVQSIEKNRSLGKEALKRIEIYDSFPKLAIRELNKNRPLIHSNKYKKILEILESRLEFKNSRL